MGGRTLLVSAFCLVLLAAPAQAIRDPPVEWHDPPAENQTCASVEKDSTNAEEASASAQVPDPEGEKETAFDIVLPDTEHFNGARLSLYASPQDCA